MTVEVEHEFEAWRATARRLLAASVEPADVTWVSVDQGQPMLPLDDPPAELPDAPARNRVPARFVAAARSVVLHRDDAKWPLLYRLLWRLREERRLLDVAADPDVARVAAMVKSVRRDEHKMHAFVRFREMADPFGARFVAWFEPAHRIVALAAPFFARRFAGMRWSILTPEDRKSVV